MNRDAGIPATAPAGRRSCAARPKPRLHRESAAIGIASRQRSLLICQNSKHHATRKGYPADAVGDEVDRSPASVRTRTRSHADGRNHGSGRQRVSQEDRSGPDGVQGTPERGRRRRRKGRNPGQGTRPQAGRAARRPGRQGRAGRSLYSPRRQVRHDGRAQLRDRFRGAQRRVQAARQGPGLAYHGRQPAVRPPRRRAAGRDRRTEADLHVPGGRQAGEHPGENRRGQTQRLVRRERAARPEVREGRDQDRPRSDPGGQLPHRRKYLGGPVRPVQGRRRRGNRACGRFGTSSGPGRYQNDAILRITISRITQEDSASWTTA